MYKKYSDPVSKKTIIEIRGQKTDGTVGFQTIVPPSVHISGETVRFEDGLDGAAAEIDSEILSRSVATCAAAALLACHWPKSSRHECELALAGVLALNRWSEDSAMKFLLATYQAVAGHDRSALDGRIQSSVRDTFAKLQLGSSAVTGAGSLAQLLINGGELVARTALKWLGIGRHTAHYIGAKEDGGPRFQCDDQGVWVEIGNNKAVRISPLLTVAARTENTNGDGCGKLVTFNDWGGRARKCIIPVDQLLGDNQEAVQKLASMGFQPDPDVKSLRLLRRYIYEANPDRIVKCVQRVGWHEDVFVFPDVSIGHSAQEYLFDSDAGAHRYRCAGTIAEWQEHVSRFCRGNSRLLFVVSCAFAAPLLDLVKSEGFGIHLRGNSSIGKTTALLVAGSVLGGDGKTGFLETWNATANGMETRAALYNDMMLPLDEISQAPDREIGDLVYVLANGNGKGRATRSISLRPSIQFRVLFLSTGERRLSEIMAAAGKQIKGGQEARLVEIEADAGAGYKLFEDLHGHGSADRFSVELKHAAHTFYGTAIREFLSRVAEHRNDFAERLVQRRREFVLATVPRGAGEVSGEVSRVAALFGIIAAAGELATEMSITRWKQGEAWTSAVRLFEGWITTRGGVGVHDVMAGIRSVIAFLQSNRGRFQDVDRGKEASPIHNRAGFRELEEDQPIHYVFANVFEDEICKGYDHRAVLRKMNELKYLVEQTGPHLKIRKRFRGEGNPRVVRHLAHHF